jgi:DNA-binding Lrp family transcriptional regulator
MELDLLDRKIAHALQIDGRAPFRAIGTALGVSDQTIARRYRRLRSSGAMRVLGLTDARRLGHVEWLIRLRCVPGAAEPIAAALARRPDTSWVSLTSGGTEIICFTRTREQSRQSQLLGALPRTPRVVAVTAHCLLRTFFGGATGWNGRADALTPEEIRRLPPPPEPVRTSIPDPDTGDEPLLTELARDGRTAYRTLAAATGRSESTVQRRVEHLRQSGALFFDVDIDPRLLGFSCEAMLWLAVPPSRLAEIGTTLANHPEVAFAAATTGPTNLVAGVGCRDVDALYDYLATRLGSLDAITHVEIAPVIDSIKRAAAPLPQ